MRGSSRDNKNVLIVDDEREFASTLVIRLQMRNFSAAMATSGGEDLQGVAKNRPGEILLQLKMPDIDGIEVFARLKKSTSAMKVIILSGNEFHEKGRDGITGAEEGFLSYPVCTG
jgi:DNA-binding response OmpR family regulator